jgi:hypothetical protein
VRWFDAEAVLEEVEGFRAVTGTKIGEMGTGWMDRIVAVDMVVVIDF